MKKQLKASFTIEAGMVIPVIMFITICVFLVCFFIHDRAVTKSVSIYYAMENAGKEEGVIEDDVMQMLNMRLTRAKDVSAAADRAEDRVSISANARMPAPFVFENDLTGDGFASFAAEVSVSNFNGRKALLTYKVMKDMAKALSGNQGGEQ